MDNNIIIFFLSTLISCFTTGFIFFDFMFSMYKPIKKKANYVLLFIVFIVLNMLISFNNIPILNSGFAFLILLYFSKKFFICTNKSCIFNSTIFLLYLIMVDVFSTFLVALITSNSLGISISNTKLFFLSGVLNSLVAIGTYQIIIKVLQKSKVSKTSIFQKCLLIFIVFFEVMIIYYIINLVKNDKCETVLIVVCIGFLIIDFAIVYLFGEISRQSSIEREFMFIKNQAAIMDSYYNNIEEKYNKSRTIIHDIKKHINVLNDLAKMNDETGQDYINNLYDDIRRLGYTFKCNNKILNVILSDRIKICNMEKIKFNIRMQNIMLQNISSMDITTLFTNLLDNAIEACDDVPENEKLIDLRIHKYKMYIIICIQNSFVNPPKIKRNKFVSTKKGHDGIGTTNIDFVVKKYEGNIKYEYENGKFKVMIIFPEKLNVDE